MPADSVPGCRGRGHWSRRDTSHSRLCLCRGGWRRGRRGRGRRCGWRRRRRWGHVRGRGWCEYWRQGRGPVRLSAAIHRIDTTRRPRRQPAWRWAIPGAVARRVGGKRHGSSVRVRPGLLCPLASCDDARDRRRQFRGRRCRLGRGRGTRCRRLGRRVAALRSLHPLHELPHFAFGFFLQPPAVEVHHPVVLYLFHLSKPLHAFAQRQSDG